jgi:polyisoprenoid-binding protein YceI
LIGKCSRLLPVLVAVLGLAQPAAAWTLDPAASHLGFSGIATGTPFAGHFERWQAQITYDPAHPDQARVVVIIDMSSATTGDSQKDQALPGADWFDTATWPQARFEAAGFVAKGSARFETTGTLTIRDAVKPVVLPFTLDLTGGTAHATGRLNLLRTDYGVGQGSWRSPEMVATQVSVSFDLTARP